MSTVRAHPPATPADGFFQQSPVDVIRTGAGRCVACGLCLPHCPTYRKTKSELESPRGRLSLMLAVARSELEPTAQLESHLSLCLTCRACEVVCPARVPFGEVMDAARAHIESRRPPSIAQRLGARAVLLLTRSGWLFAANTLLRFYQRSGLQALFRYTRLLHLFGLTEIEAELPPLARAQQIAALYPASGKRRGAVALFAGCIARLTDAPTLHSSIQVLTRLGYDVHVPSAQTCCGALHRHRGAADAADELMRRNIDAFAAIDVEAIIVSASGCGAVLAEYDGDESGARVAGKITDVSSFLQRIEWPADVRLRPLSKRIAVHDPCTLTNVMKAQHAPYELLRRIPQVEIIALPDNKYCCGGAGAYHLEHRDMAHSLRSDKIEALRRLAPDILATSNIGCAMHLAAGLRAAGLAVDVLHPVTLLAQQLDTNRD